MEFGDDWKILNPYSGKVFGQFLKRAASMKRVRKVFLRWSLKTFFQTKLVWTEWTYGKGYENTLLDNEVIQTLIRSSPKFIEL